MGNDPTARVLQLLSLLQTHRLWSGPELATRLEVSARTLRRDIDRLRNLGYPVEASAGVDGGYRLAAGSHLPPLLLDDDEAVAIAVGLRAATAASIDGIEDTSLRVLAKLDQVLPDRLRREVAAVHGNVAMLRWTPADPSEVASDALAVLARACRDHEEVRFEYRSRGGEETRRLVEPHQLVSTGRRWYLVAFDVRRGDWRTFRVDRLSEARLAGRRFALRDLPGGDAAAYVAQSLGSMPRPFEATLRTRCSVEPLADALRWIDHEVIEDAATGCRIRLRADAREQLVAAIALVAMTTAVVVEDPAEMAAVVADVARGLGAGIDGPD